METKFNFFLNIFRAHIAALLYVFNYSKASKPIWLFGAVNGEMYTDNAQFLYEWMLKNHPENQYFWVANEGSAASQQAPGQIIFKGSIKNYLYYYRANAVVFSDTLNSDIAPALFIMPLLRPLYNKTFKAYLNHGTIAFKKMPQFKGLSQTIKDKIWLSYNFASASTELEKSVFENYLPKDVIRLTGSARNDSVIASNGIQKTIFIVPTWRSWVRYSSDFKSTDFFKKYSEILSNPELQTFLKENNYKLEFFLHHFLQKFRSNFLEFQNENTHILDESTKISQKLKESSLLITDYSSVCAERYVLNKAVLFFHFDQNRYSQEMGSYIDLEKDTFGHIETSSNGTIDAIINYIKTDFKVHSLQKQGNQYFAHFRDQNNCQRIYNEIEKLMLDKKA